MWTGTVPHYTISALMRAAPPASSTRSAPQRPRWRMRGFRGCPPANPIRHPLLVAIIATSAVLASVAVAQPQRQPVSLVVIGATVITQNAAHQVLSPGAVAIDGATIVDVDRADDVPPPSF